MREDGYLFEFWLSCFWHGCGWEDVAVKGAILAEFCRTGDDPATLRFFLAIRISDLTIRDDLLDLSKSDILVL